MAARTLTAVSLGKLFNAIGWRVGFVIGPWSLMRHVQATHLVMAYVSSSPAQEAAAVGLRIAEDTGWWESNKQDVAMRVRRICDVLDELGLPYVAPAGGYFIFVNIA
ncbi:Kynurenine--oxoglutarate transaminase 3 [Xylographa pallens]|nr:Kynurenine--oxoglutarate transaminase 3 [Xylographa pallens]